MSILCADAVVTKSNSQIAVPTTTVQEIGFDKTFIFGQTVGSVSGNLVAPVTVNYSWMRIGPLSIINLPQFTVTMGIDGSFPFGPDARLGNPGEVVHLEIHGSINGTDSWLSTYYDPGAFAFLLSGPGFASFTAGDVVIINAQSMCFISTNSDF
jgi:hypothetical protein